MMKHLIGLDHVVIMVRDLDAAAAAWRRLGFTLSPRGTHSAPMGTGNYTVMLEPDYFELLGIVADTPLNADSRAWLEQREGIRAAAFRTDDAAAGVNELAEHGIAAVGPLDFGRPVALPRGGATEARFRVFQWPAAEAPAGLHIFACEHVTPEAVWITELTHHANTARRLRGVEIVAREPRAAAEHLARLTDARVEEDADGSVRVPTGSGRGTLVFLDRAGFLRRRPEAVAAALPEEGAVALVVEVDDLEKAAACAGAQGTRSATGIVVPALAATGVILQLVPR